jgi:5-methylcytosine-specific restriction endonuclease McrA
VKRSTIERAEIALAEKIQELKALERNFDVTPNVSVRRIPFVLAQIERLRKMIRRGRAERVRGEAIKIVRAIKASAAADGQPLSCESCGWSYPMPGATKVMHVHHVIPVSKGGDNDPMNLVTICPNCHATAHMLEDRGLKPKDRDELLVALEECPHNHSTGAEKNVNLLQVGLSVE